jgi:hypothetical protein
MNMKRRAGAKENMRLRTGHPNIVSFESYWSLRPISGYSAVGWLKGSKLEGDMYGKHIWFMLAGVEVTE